MVTVTDAVTLPCVFVAVRVYVVVLVGMAGELPETGTVPISEIETESALVTFQDRVTVCKESVVISLGLAVNELMIGALTAVLPSTVTETEAVTDPEAFDAVRV